MIIEASQNYWEITQRTHTIYICIYWHTGKFHRIRRNTAVVWFTSFFSILWYRTDDNKIYIHVYAYFPPCLWVFSLLYLDNSKTITYIWSAFLKIKLDFSPSDNKYVTQKKRKIIKVIMSLHQTLWLGYLWVTYWILMKNGKVSED